MNKKLQHHWLAEKFPKLQAAAIETLDEDIERHHLHEHSNLTPSQWAMFAAELATHRQGEKRKANPLAMIQPEVSKAMGVSPPSLKRAVAVKKLGPSQIIKMVKTGHMTLNAAYKGLKDEGDEAAFYKPFAKWLVHKRQCTEAKPLGGSKWPGKWGTPDVVGTSESRQGDMTQFPIDIVAAEIKTDISQLVPAFGQACIYRLFAHTSYIVIPANVPDQEIRRLQALCSKFSIGLVLFNNKHPKNPAFHIKVPPTKTKPEKAYYEDYRRRIEQHMSRIGGNRFS